MKQSILIFLMLTPALLFTQPTPEWISPDWQYSSAATPYGWFKISNNPLQYKLYKYVEGSYFQILTSVYDTTALLTIPLESLGPNGYEALEPSGEADFSGDGYNDLVFRRSYVSPNRYGFRIVNSITGENLFLFDDPSYSYSTAQNRGDNPLPWDIDGDGTNELIIKRLTSDDTIGNYLVYQTAGASTSLVLEPSQKPSNYVLNQNYPNPFNPNTMISFYLQSMVSSNLEIYDISGRLIRTYSLHGLPSGENSLIWDGKDNHGTSVATGAYFYKIDFPNQSTVKKMILIR